ncbi:MAG: exosortase/archaeosortase family protein [Pirellulales bacterium]
MTHSAPAKSTNDQMIPAVTLGILVLAIVYAYGKTLLEVWDAWDKPEYSHGYLIPAFTAVLLWLRYEPFRAVSTVERWCGVALLAAGFALSFTGSYLAITSLDMISFLPSLGGAFLLVGGWSMLRWAGPAIGFLIFMFPLPGVMARNLLNPLQKVATVCSTFALQTMGIMAMRDGNRIDLGDLQMGVVEACSGLRMVTIFLALAVALVLIIKLPRWQQLIIIASAIPIALVVNITRITVTGVLYLTVSEEIANAVFHDLAGWLMMPMALGLLFVEYQMLKHLMIDDDVDGPLSLAGR